MKIKELTDKLLAMDPEARVFMGYDSDVVVNQPEDVILVESEDGIGNCWYSVEVGDVVILSGTQ